MIKKPRLVPFDALKVFAIYLVILGHCISWGQSGNGEENVIYRIIYSFHMPLFMMISGYFSNSSIRLDFYPFIKKKFSAFIYPCIAWGLILWIILESTHSFSYGNKQFSICGLIVDFYWFSDFWFLKSCFLCYCLLFIGVHSKFKKATWIPLTLIVSQLFPPFSIPFMYPCFLIGWAIRENEKYMKYLVNNTGKLVILFITMLFFWDSHAWQMSHGIPPHFFGMGIESLSIIIFRIFRLLIGIIGSLTFISLFQNIYKIERRHIINNISWSWGQYTLEIYILHSIIIVRVLNRYIDISNLNNYLYIVNPFVSFIILWICVYLTKLTIKYQFLRKTLWGKA